MLISKVMITNSQCSHDVMTVTELAQSPCKFMFRAQFMANGFDNKFDSGHCPGMKTG